jgi:hypothetical protein
MTAPRSWLLRPALGSRTLLLSCVLLASSRSLAQDLPDASPPDTHLSVDLPPGALADVPPEDGSVDAAADDSPIHPSSASLVLPLPPVSPGPELAPVIEGPPAEGSTEPIALRDRPAALVKVILGLITLLALAYLAGHSSVQLIEERLGISQVITAGFPFVLLGLIARRPEVGVLGDEVLAELSPLLRLGLGWIGFMVGFRLDARSLDRLPRRSLIAVLSLAASPFAVVLGATALLLMLTAQLPGDLRDPVFVRDAIILGSAAATSTFRTIRLLPATGERKPVAEGLARLLRLEDAAGIFGLAVVAAYFRPESSGASWQLPGTAWLFVTLGLGMTAGLIMYALLRLTDRASELLVVTLGTIVFAAGCAGNLRLSPVVVCFVMGLLVSNAPGSYKADLRVTLVHLERPLYFLFLLIVGALWKLDDWRGWALMVLFVGGRLVGRVAGVNIANSASDLGLTTAERRSLIVAPIGPLALAVVMSAQLLYPGGSISLILTAMLGGAVVTEVLLQLAARRFARAQRRAGEP